MHKKHLRGRKSLVVNEGVRTIVSLFLFFYEKILRAQKAQTHTSEQKQKRQHFYADKKHLRGRKSLVWRFLLFTLFTFFTRFCAFYAFDVFYVFCAFYSFYAFYSFCAFFTLFVRVKSSRKKKERGLKLSLYPHLLYYS